MGSEKIDGQKSQHFPASRGAPMGRGDGTRVGGPGSELLIAAVGGGAIVAAGVWLFGRLSARDGVATQVAENKEQLRSLRADVRSKDEIIDRLLKRVGGNDAPAAAASGDSEADRGDDGESVADGEAPRVWNFVLTGGPCAGKSTALARVKSFLQNRGFYVATVSESATFLHNNGLGFYPKSPLMFQYAVTGTQYDHERRVRAYAASMARAENRSAVVLHDRGLQDGKSYCTEEEWATVLRGVSLPVERKNLFKRYDAVFHLVTAAIGASKHYTKQSSDGKMVRHETPEQAKDLDRKLRSAWEGHPKLKVFENRGTFEDKLKSLVEHICYIMDIPHTHKKPYKFRLRSLPKTFPASGLNNMSTSVFMKTYIRIPDLMEPDASDTKASAPIMFLRQRNQQALDVRNEQSLDILSHKLKVIKQVGGQTIENVRSLSRREYVDYLRFADPSRHVVKQRRIQFSYKGKFYEVIEYLSPPREDPLLLLNVHVASSSSENFAISDVPDFLDVNGDVSGRTAFSAHYLSLKNPPTVEEFEAEFGSVVLSRSFSSNSLSVRK